MRFLISKLVIDSKKIWNIKACSITSRYYNKQEIQFQFQIRKSENTMWTFYPIGWKRMAKHFWWDHTKFYADPAVGEINAELLTKEWNIVDGLPDEENFILNKERFDSYFLRIRIPPYMTDYLSTTDSKRKKYTHNKSIHSLVEETKE